MLTQVADFLLHFLICWVCLFIPHMCFIDEVENDPMRVATMRGTLVLASRNGNEVRNLFLQGMDALKHSLQHFIGGLYLGEK